MMDGKIAALMDAYHMLDRFNALPSPGGMREQAPGFQAAVRTIEQERGRILRQQQEASRREAEKAKGKGKGGGGFRRPMRGRRG